MIALDVCLNGKRVCIAGADDLGVLSAHVSACGKLGKKTVPARPDDTTGEIFFSVGGLTARPDPQQDVHVYWKPNAALKVGDVLEVNILETENVDQAIEQRPRTGGETKRAPKRA